MESISCGKCKWEDVIPYYVYSYLVPSVPDSSVVVGLVGETKRGGLLVKPDTPFLAVTKN